jgi:hypothetical protein
MSAATLLTPVSDRDFDTMLNRVATIVTGDSHTLTTYADYALNVLTPDNLEAGLLVVLGGPEARPMTQEEMDQFRFFFGQVADIAARWTGGSPPATGLVLPWLPAGAAP